MKRSLNFLIALMVFLGSGLEVIALDSHSTSKQIQGLTTVQGKDCKGDADQDCQ